MDTISVAPKTTKPHDLADELRCRIASGQWKPGDRLPSYSQSRALFGAHSVAVEKAHAQLEREGLISRERGRGIFVARAKATEGKARTGLIGVAGVGFSFREYSPYWVKLLGGIRQGCDEADAQVLLLDHLSNKGWEKADGVIVCDWTRHLTMQLLPPAMPCVSLMLPMDDCASAYADDERGGRIATEHLLALGHRKIAYLHTGDTGILASRIAGWHGALNGAGIAPKASWERDISGVMDYGARFVEQSRGAMRRWLTSDWKRTGCTAILAHNDESALGIIEALREANIRVPEDVSVVGFDGALAHEHSSAGITTIKVPLEEIGKSAARLLLRQVRGESVDEGEQNRIFPVALREGTSTARAPQSRKTKAASGS